MNRRGRHPLLLGRDGRSGVPQAGRHCRPAGGGTDLRRGFVAYNGGDEGGEDGANVTSFVVLVCCACCLLLVLCVCLCFCGSWR